MPTQRLRQARLRPAWIALLALLSVLGVWRLYVHAGIMEAAAFDVAVYQQGARDLVAGRPLYETVAWLPFTYPPFASMVFAPLAPLPPRALWVVVTLLNFALLAVVLWVAGRDQGWPRAVWLTPAMLLLACVAHNIELGQVNLLLVTLVLCDALLVPPRWRGILTGIAAGIKVTPAVFGLYFLVTRQWRAAAQAAATGVGTLALGWLVRPADSRRFWTDLLWHSDRVGGLAYVDNVSTLGALLRVWPDAPRWPATLLGLVVLLAGAWIAARIGRRDPLAALLCIAIGGLVLSPVTWEHHWVWIVPAIVWGLAHRRWALVVLTCLVLWPIPDRIHSSPLDAVVAAGYLVVAVAWLATFMRASRTDPAMVPGIPGSVS